MDGGVSGECLDYGGKSKWSGGKATRIPGKAAAAAAAAWSEGRGGGRQEERVRASEQRHLNPTSIFHL